MYNLALKVLKESAVMGFQIQTQSPDKVSNLEAKTITKQRNVKLFLATAFEFVFALTALYFRE